MWQFVGAALTFVAIPTSIFLFYRQRQRKSLAYQILTSTPVLTVGEEIRGKLAVSYENTPVKNVQLLLLKIANLGNLPITRTDFEQTLSIRFGPAAKILSHEIVESAPRDLSPKISLQSNELILEPLLLNPNDHVTVKCLVSEHDGEVTVSGRIIGVARIIQAKEPLINRSGSFLMGIIAGSTGCLFGWGAGTGRPLFYVFSGVGVTLLISCVFVAYRKAQSAGARQSG
jgi:hypothetical protein